MKSRIDRHVGYRGSILLGFAVVDLAYAITLATSDPESTAVYRWFNAIMPLMVWAAAWLAIGTMCAWFAFRDHETESGPADLPGFQAAISIKMVWGLGCVLGWAMADVPLSSLAIWLVLAFIVWRNAGWAEPRLGAQDRNSDD